MSDKPKKISNFTGFDEKIKIEDYVVNLDTDVARIINYLDRFPRIFEQSAEPAIQRNTFAFWRDTDDGKIYLLADISGNTKKVELI